MPLSVAAGQVYQPQLYRASQQCSRGKYSLPGASEASRYHTQCKHGVSPSSESCSESCGAGSVVWVCGWVLWVVAKLRGDAP
ncbi:MAG: hypothetical protein R2880_11100 [Deinococcales bacterium]